MPGYILHLTEAKQILAGLREKGICFTEKQENAFLLGSLLPDTKIKREKESSHFWDRRKMDNLAIAPELEIFEARYGGQMDTPVMLGYHAHLHLDHEYVHEFWPLALEFLGKEGEPETLREKVTAIRIRRTGELVASEDFFSSRYYYGDYSRMNAWLTEKYKITVPAYDPALLCPVEEVCAKELSRVLEELHALMERNRSGAEKELKVFDPKELEAFILKCADCMTAKIYERLLI